MPPPFEDTRFETARAVRNFVGGDAGQRHRVQRLRVPTGARREKDPRRQDALARQGKAQVARLSLMYRRRRSDHLADQGGYGVTSGVTS
jgi:hypothetical protein